MQKSTQPESWKSIFGYEGFYEVSSLGNVRSLDRASTFLDGKKYIRKGQMLSLSLRSDGYFEVSLCIESKSKRQLVHRLVAQAFLHNPDYKAEVNHKDFNRQNNTIENLEWTTHQENVDHAFLGGRHTTTKGEERVNHKLSDELVKEIRHRYATENISISKLSKDYPVGYTTVRYVIQGKKWKHIT